MYISTFPRLMTTKLDRLLTLRRRFSTQMLKKLLPTSYFIYNYMCFIRCKSDRFGGYFTSNRYKVPQIFFRIGKKFKIHMKRAVCFGIHSMADYLQNLQIR